MMMKRTPLCAALALLLLSFYVSSACAAECAHENLGDIWLSSRHNLSAFTPVDEHIHYYTHDFVIVANCKDCDDDEHGIVVGEPIKTGVRVEEEHMFDNGVCEDCGYAYTCTHNNTYTTSRNDPANNFRTYVDEQFHSALYHKLINTYCRDCGERIGNTEIERDAGQMLEMHEFDENNLCRCGYQKPACAHKNTYIRYYDHDRYESYDNVASSALRHAYESRVYADIYCEDCGDPVDHQFLKTEMILQNHAKDDGECTVCGYKDSSCAHTYTIQEEQFLIFGRSAEHLNEKTHRMYGQLIELEYCISCENRTGDRKVLDYDYSEVQLHEWEGNSCRYCGYVNQCKHPTTETEYTYINLRDANVKNAAEHWVYAEKMKITRCSVCGYELDCRLEETDVALTRSHEFTGGICWMCEYVKDDPYPEMIRQVGTDISDFKEEPSTEPVVVDTNGQLPPGARVVVEDIKQFSASTTLYEIEIMDINNNVIEPDGTVTLILPYPKGKNMDSQLDSDFVIIHDGKDTYSTADGSAVFMPQGIGIKVKSFSPFTVEQVAKPQTAALPETGDSSQPLVYAALLCAAVIACALVNRKRRTARS